MIDGYLFIKIHLLFVDNLCFKFSKKVQDGLLIHRVSHKRMLEQFLDVGPLVRILHQAQLQEVVEVFGPPGGVVQPRRVGLLDLEQHAHGSHLVERGLHLSKLYQGHAQAPNINLKRDHHLVRVAFTRSLQECWLATLSIPLQSIYHQPTRHPAPRSTHLVVVGFVPEGLAGHHLGRHPVGGADEGVPPLVVLLQLGGHSEVGELDVALQRQQDVAGLQVAVDDAVPERGSKLALISTT